MIYWGVTKGFEGKGVGGGVRIELTKLKALPQSSQRILNSNENWFKSYFMTFTDAKEFSRGQTFEAIELSWLQAKLTLSKIKGEKARVTPFVSKYSIWPEGEQ